MFSARLGISAASLIAIGLSALSMSGEPPSKVDTGLIQTKQLLKLMDTDVNGKVSKQEFMSFMEAEFDRLDVNKDGELDVNELSKIHVRSYPYSEHR